MTYRPNPAAPDLPLGELVPCPDCNPGAAPEPVERRYRDSGIAGPERERCTFARFELAANPGMRMARDAARSWGNGEGLPFLFLFSTTRGVGKTHLAIAAAQACIARGEPVSYWPVPSLLDALRATQRPGGPNLEDVRGRVERCPNVVLDDLGAQRDTGFADEELYTIVNQRWRYGLRTLVTTNVPAERLEPRIASRLIDWQTSLVVECTGRDYREGRPGR